MSRTSANAVAPRLTAASSDQLAKALREGRFGAFEAHSDFASCLMPLLKALGWRGNLRHVAEALPHFANTLGLADFRNVLARLGYKTVGRREHVANLDPRLLPCLLVADDGRVLTLLKKSESTVGAFDPTEQQERTFACVDLKGTVYLIAHEDRAQEEIDARQQNWMGQLLRRFRGTIAQLLATTFILNLLALAVPIFIMTLYDQVIPSQSPDVLAYLVIGLAIALAAEAGLRAVRARAVAFMGGRIENIVANESLARILSFSASLTESAPVGAQVARLREFESVRELFTGPLVNLVLELPFLVLFLAVIVILGGPLALVPVVMMGVFALMAVLLGPALKRSISVSSKHRARQHGFLVETITNLRSIKETGAEDVWLERYREISANTAFSHFRTSQISFLFQTLGQATMLAAGAATVALGVLRVLDGAMTVGALIATMILVWRVLSPIQNLFLTLTRFEQIKISIKQINQLMRMPIEEDRREDYKVERRFAGAISFSRVSFRYNSEDEPALLGATFDIKPGELIVLVGPNGAGKSTILSLVAGLYRPQAGQVSVDGLDIRQINPFELRQAVAYVPQESKLFHGTVAQNLRLAEPTASEEALREACAMAGALEDVDALPEGLHTRLGDQSMQRLNSGFRQRLILARAYVKKAPVLLLDEPAQNLDEAGDAYFVEMLKSLKGNATAIMVSHRPSHMRLADRILVFDSGVQIAAGPPEEVLSKLPGGAL